MAHNNFGYDAIVLDNNLVEFGVKHREHAWFLGFDGCLKARAYQYHLADSLEIMRSIYFYF